EKLLEATMGSRERQSTWTRGWAGRRGPKGFASRLPLAVWDACSVGWPSTSREALTATGCPPRGRRSVPNCFAWAQREAIWDATVIPEASPCWVSRSASRCTFAKLFWTLARLQGTRGTLRGRGQGLATSAPAPPDQVLRAPTAGLGHVSTPTAAHLL